MRQIERWIGLLLVGLGFGVWGVPLLTLALNSSQASFDGILWNAAFATLKLSATTTLVVGLIGLVGGLFLGRRVPPRAATVLLLSSFCVPGFFLAMSWIETVGTFGFWPIVATLAYANAAWVALGVSQELSSLPRMWLESAQSVGLGPRLRFRHVIWPWIRPRLVTQLAQVYVWSATSFSVVILVGGGPSWETLETAIYTNLRYEFNLDRALGGVVLQCLVVLVPSLAFQWVTKRSLKLRAETALGQSALMSYRSAFTSIVLAGFLATPLFYVVFKGVTQVPEWHDIQGPLGASLFLSALTVLGTAVLGFMSFLEGGRFSQCWLWPSTFSPLMLALGMWLAYGPSLVTLLLVQICLFSPILLRTLFGLMQTTQLASLQVAQSLGFSRMRAFWIVEWPRFRAPVLGALGLVFVFSLGELGIVSLYSGTIQTAPLQVATWMGQYEFAQAFGLSAILFLISAAVLLPSIASVKRVV